MLEFGLVRVELFGLKVDLPAGARKAAKKLPKRDLLADGFDFLNKLPTNFVQQVRIGGIGNVLGLGRGVHRHALGLDQPQLAPALEGYLLNDSHPFGADTLAKFRHGRAVQNPGRLRLIKPAKGLPIVVLIEILDRLLVRDIVAVLEDVHSPTMSRMNFGRRPLCL